MTRTSPAAVPLAAWAAFALLALLGQSLLIANPGYFSHDELQWAAMADAGMLERAPWQVWTQWRSFQWRPLTFTLWLLLSAPLFPLPWAFHGVLVLMGTAVGAGLLRILVRLGVAPQVATVAALGFVLGPVAMFVHGWVATLADLLWVGAGVLAADRVLAWKDRPDRTVATVATVALLASLALLAKEAAIVLPALAALAWLLSGRRREWALATVASAVPTAVYLAARLEVILFTPRAAGTYEWSPLSVPVQWLKYQVYPLAPSVFEPDTTLLVSRAHLVVACGLLLALLAAAWRADRRAAAWWVVGGATALGPVLILNYAANQYAYGFSVLVAGALAVAWARMGRPGRALLALLLVVSTWHGVAVMRTMHSVGERQARFSQGLVQVVQAARGSAVRVRLPRDEDDSWIFRRLGHDVPTYLGVPLGDRVVLLERNTPTPADYEVLRDGSLRAVR